MVSAASSRQNSPSPSPLRTEYKNFDPPIRDDGNDAWVNIVGVPRDITQRELHVLFSGCRGYRCALVVRGPKAGYSMHPDVIQAFVSFDSGVDCKAACTARAGTTWAEKSFPVAFTVVNAPENEAADLDATSKPETPGPKMRGCRSMPGSPLDGRASLWSHRSCVSGRTPAHASQGSHVKQKAKSLLENAVQSHKARELERALAAGREAGLSEPDMVEAEEALAAIEWRVTARRIAATRDRKSMALVRLSDAIAMWQQPLPLSKRMQALREAVRGARNAGMEEQDYHDATKLIEQEDRKLRAEEGLERCLNQPESRCKPEVLRNAIEIARDSGVEEHVLHRAAFTLAVVERKAHAKKNLETAVHGGSYTRRGAIFMNANLQHQLLHAFEEAKVAGLDDQEIKDARVAVASERRAYSEQKLEDAIKSKQISALQAALKEGQAAGAEDDLIQNARAILEQQEHRVLGSSRARGTRAMWRHPT